MLHQRLIPCLLLSNGGFVKTTNFSDPKYLGDPVNIIRIFNELEVDEISIFDIDASENGVAPNFQLIKKLANECRMPLCYGGGITNPDQAEHLISLGLEKISINSATFRYPDIITETAKRVGSQSVVASMDVLFNKGSKTYEVISAITPKVHVTDLVVRAQLMEEMGAGEILINCVHRDGTLLGYDYEILEQLYDKVDIPITILGGARGPIDIKKMAECYPNTGVGIGSYFVFKGKFRAVLVSYPSWKERVSF